MFDLYFTSKGERVLSYVKRDRLPGETGMWVEICNENDKEASYLVMFNRQHGLQVEKDDKGFFRALVLRH